MRLVRHGEVAEPHRGTLYGQLDVPLSPEGLSASLGLAAELAGAAPACIYSSPLARARVLAQAVASACRAPLVIEPAFRELDRGSWTGRARSALELEAPGALAAYVADPEHHNAPDGERESALAARVWSALEPMAARHAGQQVLLVAHAHVLRVIMARLAGWTAAESMRHFLPLLGVAEVALSGGGGRILSAPQGLDQERVLRP